MIATKRDYYSAHEVLALLGIGKSTLAYHVKHGNIRPFRRKPMIFAEREVLRLAIMTRKTSVDGESMSIPEPESFSDPVVEIFGGEA